MTTTLALDDDLVRIAQEFTGVSEKTALVREALKALIERESARRLASLGGTMPHLKNLPRHRGPELNPPTLLWTKDKPLRKVAEGLGIHAGLA